MKNTSLSHIHELLGARMVEYAGFNMPLEYSGILNEHNAVRNHAGLFDVSHMGSFWVKGGGAFELLQKLTTNDISLLEVGKIQYSCFPNGKGGIVDDLLVYKYSQTKYMVVVNASNIEKDWNWINSQNNFGAQFENASDNISIIALQGPNSKQILQNHINFDIEGLRPFTFMTCSVANVQDVILSETGYTGAGGYEIYCRNDGAEKIWKALLAQGAEFGLKPAGLAVRDLLRLEMGYTSPIEAGLGWIVKFVDGNDFIDRPLLENQKKLGVKKKLTGFEMIDKGIPRKDYKLFNTTGHEIGTVTSGTQSPLLQKGIGMAYINSGEANLGNEIFVEVRNKQLRARVVKLPFIK
jgi:aminomethyltransferase